MSRKQILRLLVNERLTAAAEEILGVFERTIEEYELEIDRQRELLDALKTEMRTDSLPPQLLVSEEEVQPEQQERSPGLLQGLEQNDIIELTLCPVPVKCENDGGNTQSLQLSQIQDPELPRIKQEQEELFQDPEEADGSNLTLHPVKYENNVENTLSLQFSQTQDPELLQIKDELFQVLDKAERSKITALPVKCEVGQENAQPFQPLQTQSLKTTETYSLPSTSTEQMKTEPDGEDCGVSEPASNLDPSGDLEPTRDGQLLSSDCSGTETDCMEDDWKPQSGLNALKSKKAQKVRESLSNGNKSKRSVELSHDLKEANKVPFPHCCNVCGLTCANKCSFMKHIKFHLSDCGLCGKHLEPTELLSLHLQAHRTCHFCGKVCPNYTKLERHVRVHTGEKVFGCSVCGKQFADSSTLAKHARTHTGEKPFSCTVCGHKFSRKASMMRHMIIHTGEKAFSCTVCDRRFGQKEQVKRHMVTYHTHYTTGQAI